MVVLRLVHMFLIKRPTQYGFCALFAPPWSSFLEGPRSFAHIVFLGHFFFKKFWALRSWCAHNIFISCPNPVSRTRTSFLAVRSSLLSLYCALTDTRWSIHTSRWLMLADCSLFYVARYPLISTRCFPLFLLVAAEFSLLAGLYSLHTAHGTSSCSLIVARWSP